MENNCLQSAKAFDAYYSGVNTKDVVLTVGAVSITSGAGVAGGAAITAATTGVAGIALHLTSVPIIGGIATSIVSGAVTAAILPVLPIAVFISAGISLPLIIKLKKNRKRFRNATSPEVLAREVSKIIFLPLFAFFISSINEGYISVEEAKKKCIKKILKWGYTKQYTEELVDTYFQKKAEDLNIEFKNICNEIKGLQNKSYYHEICYKEELPVESIILIANSIVNDFSRNDNQGKNNFLLKKGKKFLLKQKQ